MARGQGGEDNWKGANLAVKGHGNLSVTHGVLAEEVEGPLARSRPLLRCSLEHHRPVPRHVNLALLGRASSRQSPCALAGAQVS
jgi:hypothetical protein